MPALAATVRSCHAAARGRLAGKSAALQGDLAREQVGRGAAAGGVAGYRSLPSLRGRALPAGAPAATLGWAPAACSMTSMSMHEPTPADAAAAQRVLAWSLARLADREAVLPPAAPAALPELSKQGIGIEAAIELLARRRTAHRRAARSPALPGLYPRDSDGRLGDRRHGPPGGDGLRRQPPGGRPGRRRRGRRDPLAGRRRALSRGRLGDLRERRFDCHPERPGRRPRRTLLGLASAGHRRRYLGALLGCGGGARHGL